MQQLHAPPAATRPPLVLIVNHQEWSARAVDAFLAPAGFAVLRAYTASSGLARAVAGRPDVVMVAERLPDMSGGELCLQLAADPRVGAATPILLVMEQECTRDARIAALEAGAWDVVSLPIDASELLAKLNTWIRAKREIERARNAGLLDELTGLYNTRGLLHRADELAAEAARYHKPLACVVFTLSGTPRADADLEADIDPIVLSAVRDALRATVRSCDALGRLTGDKFAVLAPATDAAGALRLAQRALENLDARLRSGELAPLRVQAGYFGVADFHAANVEPPELLARAVIATTHDPTEARIRGYDSNSSLN